MSAVPGVTADGYQTILPGLFAWHAYEPSVRCELSSCAIETGSGLLFIDPIPLRVSVLMELTAQYKPSAIVITNGNHARGAAEMRARFGVRIFAHRHAADSDMQPDAFLSEGDLVAHMMRVVEIPGAGPGEIALVGRGVACVGDALIHLPPEGLRPLPDKYCADPMQNRLSLRKLLSCDFEVMTFAHGAPVVEAARRSLETLLA